MVVNSRLKFKKGGKNPPAFSTISPDTKTAVLNAFQESIDNPTTATERFEEDFQPES